MAEDTEKKTSELAEEAKRALLEAIIDYAPKASPNRLEETARAYALVVGARPGVVPGGPLAVGSS